MAEEKEVQKDKQQQQEEEDKHPNRIKQKDIDDLLKIDPNEDDGWSVIIEKEKVSAWKKPHDKSGLYIVKGIAKISGHPPRKIFRIMYDLDIASTWGEGWKKMEFVERVDDYNEILYLLGNTPRLVTPRYFVQYRSKHVSKDKKVCSIIYKNGQHAKYTPDKHKWHVKGETLGITGYVVRLVSQPDKKDKEDGDASSDSDSDDEEIDCSGYECAVEFTSCVDVKGSIPKAIVNWFAQRTPKAWGTNLQKACDANITLKDDHPIDTTD